MRILRMLSQLRLLRLRYATTAPRSLELAFSVRILCIDANMKMLVNQAALVDKYSWELRSCSWSFEDLGIDLVWIVS